MCASGGARDLSGRAARMAAAPCAAIARRRLSLAVLRTTHERERLWWRPVEKPSCGAGSRRKLGIEPALSAFDGGSHAMADADGACKAVFRAANGRARSVRYQENARLSSVRHASDPLPSARRMGTVEHNGSAHACRVRGPRARRALGSEDKPSSFRTGKVSLPTLSRDVNDDASSNESTRGCRVLCSAGVAGRSRASESYGDDGQTLWRLLDL